MNRKCAEKNNCPSFKYIYITLYSCQKCNKKCLIKATASYSYKN